MSETNSAGTKSRTDGDVPPNKKPADLSKFQLRILAVLTDAEDAPKGVTIKRRLRTYYDDEVNHGRLYPNLDELVTDGFVTKGRKDQRTNAYDITGSGRNALVSEVAWLVERTDDFEEADS
jgi:DNA-binding PadR family transcriptional regulator